MSRISSTEHVIDDLVLVIFTKILSYALFPIWICDYVCIEEEIEGTSLKIWEQNFFFINDKTKSASCILHYSQNVITIFCLHDSISNVLN